MNDYLTFDALCEIATEVGKYYPLYKYLVEEKIPNMSLEELQNFKDDLEAAQLAEAINTNTPYIIDKLYAARVKNENELLSFLGIDNTGNAAKATTETLDEVNANNVLINLGQDEFLTNLQEFTDSIQEVLGVTISAKMKADRAEETAESRNKSDAENEAEEEVEEDGQD